MTVKQLKKLLETIDDNKTVEIEIRGRGVNNIEVETVGKDGYEYENRIIIKESLWW